MLVRVLTMADLLASSGVPISVDGGPTGDLDATSALLYTFHSRLSSLCLAAGPPAPSFSLADIDACIAMVTERPEVYGNVLEMCLGSLAADAATTPMSVRAMLFSLLARFTEKTCSATTNATHRHEEWSILLAPQLYRVVSLVLPKFEDATANVGLARSTLQRWMAQAENPATSSAAPFKKHQLINAIKYIEGYTYVPPPPSDAERLERKARRREKRRAREEAEKKARKKRKHDAAASAAGIPATAAEQPDDSISRTSSTHSPNSAMDSPRSSASSGSSSRDRSRSRSRSSPRSSSRSPAPPPSNNPAIASSILFAERFSSLPQHSASSVAFASRFLEQLRASQKREQTEGNLRREGEWGHGRWEEWRECRERVGERRRRFNAAQQHQHQNGLPTDNPSFPTNPPASASTFLTSFLTSWLSSRHHWRATREDLSDAIGETYDGGEHELEEWKRYYASVGAGTMPSGMIPHGAQRLWSKLNEPQAINVPRSQGRLLPPPPPSKIYAHQTNQPQGSAATTSLLTATAVPMQT